MNDEPVLSDLAVKLTITHLRGMTDREVIAFVYTFTRGSTTTAANRQLVEIGRRVIRERRIGRDADGAVHE